MLKFVENRDEAMDIVSALASQPEVEAFRVGLAGSYAVNTNKKASSIDIVLKLKDGKDSELIGDFNISEAIFRFIEAAYSNKINLIWLDLLEVDETALLDYMAKAGMEKNPESVYTNIVEEVKWVDEMDSDDDEDGFDSKLYTSDSDDEEDSEEEDE